MTRYTFACPRGLLHFHEKVLSSTLWCSRQVQFCEWINRNVEGLCICPFDMVGQFNFVSEANTPQILNISHPCDMFGEWCERSASATGQHLFLYLCLSTCFWILSFRCLDWLCAVVATEMVYILIIMMCSIMTMKSA